MFRENFPIYYYFFQKKKLPYFSKGEQQKKLEWNVINLIILQMILDGIYLNKLIDNNNFINHCMFLLNILTL